MGIANRMEANLRANDTVTRGISDAISLQQTANGGLDNINELLQRGRQLAVQAANGTLSTADRGAVQREFHHLRDQIDKIAYETEIFDKYPLAPAKPHQVDNQLGNVSSVRDVDPKIGMPQTSGSIPLGFIPTDVAQFSIRIDDLGMNDDLQIFTRDGKHLIGTSLGAESTWSSSTVDIHSGEDVEQKVFTSSNGFEADAEYDYSLLLDGSDFFDRSNPRTLTYNGMTLSYSGDGNPATPKDTIETLNIDHITEPLFVMVTGEGSFVIEEFDWVDDPPEPTPISKPVDIVVDAQFGEGLSKVTIDPAPADARSLGIAAVSLETRGGASSALEKFDSALSILDQHRSRLGALHNRFEGSIENLQQQKISTSSAVSRIMDADYSSEIVNLTKAQILQQAGTSMLAQANQVPQTVLALLG